MVTAQVRRGIQYDLSSLAFAPRIGKVLVYTALHWTSILTPLVGTHKKGNRQQVGSLDNSEIAGWVNVWRIGNVRGRLFDRTFYVLSGADHGERTLLSSVKSANPDRTQSKPL